MANEAPCPCGSQQNYNACCGIYIAGIANAPTPEALMRSRYTAYTRANIPYIAHTMTGPAAQHFDPLAAKQWASSVQWIKLEVLQAQAQDDKGEVTFKAHYKEKNKVQILTERSVFQRINGRWFYVDRL